MKLEKRMTFTVWTAASFLFCLLVYFIFNNLLISSTQHTHTSMECYICKKHIDSVIVKLVLFLFFNYLRQTKTQNLKLISGPRNCGLMYVPSKSIFVLFALLFSPPLEEMNWGHVGAVDCNVAQIHFHCWGTPGTAVPVLVPPCY